MRILIKVKGTATKCFIDNNLVLSGTLKRNFFKSLWTLSDENKEFKFSYKTEGKYFNPDFVITATTLSEKQPAPLKLIFVQKKTHIRFRYDDAEYIVVFHLGTSISFYKENIQFASMEYEMLVVDSEETYKIAASEEINIGFLLMLIYAVIIVIGILYFSDSLSDFTFNFGNFISELKPINRNWQPNPL